MPFSPPQQCRGGPQMLTAATPARRPAPAPFPVTHEPRRTAMVAAGPAGQPFLAGDRPAPAPAPVTLAVRGHPRPPLLRWCQRRHRQSQRRAAAGGTRRTESMAEQRGHRRLAGAWMGLRRWQRRRWRRRRLQGRKRVRSARRVPPRHAPRHALEHNGQRQRSRHILGGYSSAGGCVGRPWRPLAAGKGAVRGAAAGRLYRVTWW